MPGTSADALLMAYLKPYKFRQANALIHYYGLCGTPASPLDEIAEMLELSERKTALALKHGCEKLLQYLATGRHPDFGPLRSRIEANRFWQRALR